MPATGCHSRAPDVARPTGTRLRVALVGSPNVGKSALFNRLTGRYVTVSNYPGTSVEVSRGAGTFAGRPVEVIDTPGMYALASATEEQRVVRRFLLGGEADVLVQVVDAKNVPRMLSLTLQLLELGRPLVVAVNMMDEATRLGLAVNVASLAGRLGVGVVPIVAVRGTGIEALQRAVVRAAERPAPLPPGYGNGVGTAIRALRAELTGAYAIDTTALAALLLQQDEDAAAAGRAAGAAGGARALRSRTGRGQGGRRRAACRTGGWRCPHCVPAAGGR